MPSYRGEKKAFYDSVTWFAAVKLLDGTNSSFQLEVFGKLENQNSKGETVARCSTVVLFSFSANPAKISDYEVGRACVW